MNFKDIFKLKKNICLSSSSTSLFLSLTQKIQKTNLVYFSNNNKYLTRLKNEIELIDSDIRVFILDDFDCTFFSNLSPTREILSKRINAIYQMIFNDYSRKIFLININSVVNKLIPVNKILQKKFLINENKRGIYETVIKYLNENMYEKVEFVRNKGEFALRGDIIDIFSPNESYPVRISFNFDDVESLYSFNLDTQKSLKKLKSYTLFLASEILFNDESIRNFRQNFRKLKIHNKEEYYKSISNKIFLPGSDQFYPILFNKFNSVIDYFNNCLIFIQHDFFLVPMILNIKKYQMSYLL